MAYSGSTSGSTVANPPALTQSWLAGSTNTGAAGLTATSQFVYRSTHTQAETAATGFITDAKNLGMSLGDSVLVLGSTTYILSHHTVQAVSSTGATLSAGLLVSSAS